MGSSTENGTLYREDKALSNLVDVATAVTVAMGLIGFNA